MTSNRSGFRLLTDDDLPMMHRWLNDPGVVRWWEGDDVGWEAVIRDYGSGNRYPVEHWIYLVDSRPLGWIQNYRLRDLPEVVELWSAVDHHPDLVGLDYLIAGAHNRGRGVGSTMISEFCRLLFQRPDPPAQLGADPVEANVASWRALEKAGFRHAGTAADSRHGPIKIMVLDRPQPSKDPQRRAAPDITGPPHRTEGA